MSVDQVITERTNPNEHLQVGDIAQIETGNAAHLDRKGIRLKLVPLQPPGRITRKARDFKDDIVQLRAQGYTLDAIRIALEAAGVRVSISTVRREALRLAQAASASARDDAEAQDQIQPRPPKTGNGFPASIAPPTDPASPGRRSGRDVAEDYVKGLITNQFVRAREER